MPSKYLLLLVAPLIAAAQDRPLASLPYTPSLEPKFIDRSADPCTNFYQFACGNWNKLNPMPPEEAVWNVYSKLQTDNMRLLWGVLEAAAKPSPGRSGVERSIGDYFAACMDEAAIERAGARPLRPMLDAIASLKRKDELAKLLGQMHLASRGSDAAFGFGSNQDFADSNSVIAFATAGGLGLPDRDYYVKTDAKSKEIRERYVQHVAAMLRLLGDSDAAARAGAQTVMAMETALAKASLTRVDQRDPYKLFHKLNTADVQGLTRAFDWKVYFSTIGLPTPAVINVSEPEFYRELQRQIVQHSVEDWKTYLRWHAVHQRAPYLSRAFVEPDFEFYGKYLRGVSAMQPRWKRCVNWVDRDLGEALGQAFVQRTFTPATKASALKMTKEIEAAMDADLRQLPWMGEATRQQALTKLHGVVNKIGYPEHPRDYSSIKITRDNFLGDVEGSFVFERKRDLAKIGRPVDRSEWEMTAPTVNAYYDPQMNDINFPAGVLQPPLFDPKMDDAPNYGNTGATIGHELTHGFDDEGRQFDAKGNLKDWWTPKDAQEFLKRAECVSNQYSQYTVVDNIKINGKLTMGEDIADLGGTMLAYTAWKTATKGQQLKPADGLTPDQRFFVGMAQWACGDERPENKRMRATLNPHSPDEYRINGVVSNMPEFGKAFSCKAGQAMVRPQACKVW
ncbi:MAG TPA: M13 family metallopeptidase [Candidatus Limnocylindrales bacterium]|nr:M13 family metallopeptidase [Candidatus Limnocylindrales bacterium]